MENQNGLNVLSLFDGISCCRLALDRAGIKVNKYFASEIDKHAIKVAQHNYPDTIQLGSVIDVKAENLPKIDLLTGGFCCQSFSFAGKQLNFDDPRGKLFFECVRLLEEIKKTNPYVKFLFENVRMKKEYSDFISEKLGVKPLLINSSLVSAQNRWRLYWTNIPNATIPEDRGIFLKDIIEEDYDGIFVIPRGGNPGGVQSYKGKSPSITISSWEHNFFIYNGAAKRTFPRNPTGEKREKRLEIRKDGKANCVTTHPLDSILHKAGTEGSIRAFTPEECEKLQTVPVGYTSVCSKSQRIKQLGNGWTVSVIAHLFKGLKDN
jgi:DNA-cytosine methyltransferase